jgi:hypothetical protein
MSTVAEDQQARLGDIDQIVSPSAFSPIADKAAATDSGAMCQQPASGRSSRVGVAQLSWSPALIDASADRHFNRDMAWQIDS